MRLVHQPEHDLGLPRILLGQLGPNASELSIGRSALTDNPTVPSSVVVEVQDGISSLAQDVLNELVVLSEPRGVEVPAQGATDGRVPAKGKSEDVGSVLAKVVDLGLGGVGGGQWVDVVARVASVGVGTKVEAAMREESKEVSHKPKDHMVMSHKETR